ncbi:FkbM family methyltransferase [Bacillus sp. V3-13]|uniref:FkbM family methyltransferase n=1 Tax=Bacillus sp. V3-13 TaxID=2053728 RepID=UPI000C75EADE|nr:FkbM family methyltransferase [Bacillus sp. V3-13]PLR76591.1 FkbM family methyltransferase [Bacillus sp. V3-13]
MERPIIYIGDNTILTKLIYTPVIYLDPRDIVQAHIMLHGFWEHGLTANFFQTVKPGMKVLDIGAHCGYYTLLASLLTGPTGEVHAFEPNPAHFTNLRRSLLINGYNHANIHQVGLSNKNEEVILYVPDGGGATIINPGSEYQKEVKMKTVVFSEYFPPQQVDVMKIDIDGSEPLIMDDVIKIVDKSDNIQIFLEYAPTLWVGHDPKISLQKFADRGFNFYKVAHTGVLEPTTVEEVVAFEGPLHIDLKLTRN